MIKLKCDICHADVKEASDMGQARRNLGLHKRAAHNIVSDRDKYYVPVWAQPDHPKYDAERAAELKRNPTAGSSDPQKLDSIAKAREARQRERLNAKARELSKTAIPMRLLRCPNCDSEFLKRINGKVVPTKLSDCADCGIRFYYIKIVTVEDIKTS